MTTENQYIGQKEFTVNGEHYFSFTPYKWITGKSFGDTAVGGMISNIPFVGNTIAPSSGGGNNPAPSIPNAGDLANLRENDLIHDARDGKVYLFTSGQKRWFPNAQIASSWIQGWESMPKKGLNAPTIDAIPTGEPFGMKPANAPDLSKAGGGLMGGNKTMLYAGIGGAVLIIIIVLYLIFK
jgi:hypothetical protein